MSRRKYNSNVIVFFITHLNLGGAQLELLNEFYLCENLGYDCYLIYNGDCKIINKISDSKKIVIRNFRREISIFDVNVFFVLLSRLYTLSPHKIIYTGPKASLIGSIVSVILGIPNRIYRSGGQLEGKYSYAINSIFLAFFEIIILKLSTELWVVTSQMITYYSKLVNLENYKIEVKFSKPAKSLFSVNSQSFTFEGVNKRLKICCALSLLKSKTPLEIIKVAKLIRDITTDFQIDIFGEGDEFAMISNKIQEFALEDNVHLKGRVDNFDSVIQSYDLFLHLSLYYEGLPQVVCQALAAKIPVIAYRRGGVQDIVFHNINGWVFDRVEYKKVAKLIAYLIRNNEVLVLAKSNMFDIKYLIDPKYLN